jgi:hypothetical protein
MKVIRKKSRREGDIVVRNAQTDRFFQCFAMHTGRMIEPSDKFGLHRPKEPSDKFGLHRPKAQSGKQHTGRFKELRIFSDDHRLPCL